MFISSGDFQNIYVVPHRPINILGLFPPQEKISFQYLLPSRYQWNYCRPICMFVSLTNEVSSKICLIKDALSNLLCFDLSFGASPVNSFVSVVCFFACCCFVFCCCCCFFLGGCTCPVAPAERKENKHNMNTVINAEHAN